MNSTTVRLVDGRTGATVAGAVSYNAGSKTATITPAAALHRANPYRIVVDGVLSATGKPGPVSDVDIHHHDRWRALGPAEFRGPWTTRVVRVGLVRVAGRGPGRRGRPHAVGATPPASPTDGTAGYIGVGGGIMIGALTPGLTYSFSVWYHDRNGNLSPQSTATLVGTTLTMTGTSAAPGAGTADVTFTGSVAIPTGAGAGVPVPLVAYCAEGPFNGLPVATSTGDASGLLSTILALGSPRCSYRWEISNSTQYMGGFSTGVRVNAGPNPPPGQTPPRQR